MWTHGKIFRAGLRIGSAGLVAATASGCELSRPSEDVAPVDVAETAPLPIGTIPVTPGTTPIPVLPTGTPTTIPAPTPTERADEFYFWAWYFGTASDGQSTDYPSWKIKTNGVLPAGQVDVELAVEGDEDNPENKCLLEITDTKLEHFENDTTITAALPKKLIKGDSIAPASLTIHTALGGKPAVITVETDGPTCIDQEELPPGVPRSGETVID